MEGSPVLWSPTCTSPAPNGASEGLHFCHLPRLLSPPEVRARLGARGGQSGVSGDTGSGGALRGWGGGHRALGLQSRRRGRWRWGWEAADHRHAQGEAQSSTGVDEGQEWKQGWEDRRQPRPRAEAGVSKGTHGKLNSGHHPSG